MKFNGLGKGLRGGASALALALTLLARVPAQQQPAPQPQDDEEVVRISSNLIQIDAVVLDLEGRQVTDLTADDFELSEDGRPQAITNFSYVDNSAGAKASGAGTAAPTNAAKG